MKHIAVIGAGIAGAGAARKLRQAGHRVTVFERASFVGGRTHTFQGDGFQVNTGAGFFTNFYPHFSALVQELGLENKIIENPKIVTLANGERSYHYNLHSIPSFFRIPFLTLGDKLKLAKLSASLMLKKKRLHLTDPHALAVFDKESIAEFSRRKLGERAYQYLVRPAIESYWYFSCEEASVAMMMGLQAVASSARFFGLKDGIDQVSRKMMAEEDLQLETGIEQIKSLANRQLELELSGGGKHKFDGVVVATTASVANSITQELSIPKPVRSFLNSQSYAANINAYFFLPKQYLDGVPVQISSCGPKTDTLAAIAQHGSQIVSGKHEGLGILGVWLLDKPSRDMLDASEETIAAKMWDLARQYHPELPKEPTRLARMNKHREAIPLHAPKRYQLASNTWKAQDGPVVFAGDYLTLATMEGALQSGYWAADILNKQFTL